MLSKRILELQPSATLSLDEKAKQLAAAGFSVINLTLGEPDFSTPEHIREAGREAITSGFTHYVPSAGIPRLRQLVALKLLKENNISYEPDEIIIGVGAKQILYLAFQALCNPGDEVIIPTPAWSTYAEQVTLAEATPILARLQPPFKATASVLEKHLSPKTKVILLNSPSNPTGAVIEKAELEKIAAMAIQRNVFLISDEIYEKILYGGTHCSIASLGEATRNRTVTVNGVSKAYAMTGWRVGFGAGPREVIQGMVSLASQTTSGTSSISQQAAVAAITGQQQPVIEMVRVFAQRRKLVCAQLSAIRGISLHEPEGAFYVFFNIDKLLSQYSRSSAEWAQALLDREHVAVVPGEAFHAPGYIRLSFAASQQDLTAGIHRIKKFVYEQ
ncbi:MAG: pyridoxal phosphate-dependent aminotransferase [Patescibacteria group bacterium]